MISRSIRIIAYLAGVHLLVPTAVLPRPQISGTAVLVEVDGLKPTYASCARFNFSVKNISEQDVYVEVYAEKFDSGSWKEEDYPYDLKDPRTRYIKRVLVNPDMLRPGSSLPLTYDRCLRPTFLKENDTQFRKTIRKKDSRASPQTLQRFRVDVYFLEEGHVKFIQKAYSEPFKRLADGNLAGSPAQ